MAEIKFNDKAVGQKLYPSVEVANIRFEPSTTANVVGKATKSDVLTRTGYLSVEKGQYNWYEVKLNAVKGWVRSDVIVTKPGAKKVVGKPTLTNSEDAKTLLANVLKNDRYTYHNLLLANDLIKRNSGTPTALVDKYKALASNYNARQGKISKSQWIEAKTGKVEGAWEWLKEKMGISGIGVIQIPAIVLYIGGAALVAGGALIVYEMLKPEEKKSFEDFKGSEELTQKLYALLPKEQADEVLAMTKATTQDAYQQGKSDGGGVSAKLRNYGIFAAIAAGAYFFVKSQKGKK